MVQTRTRVASHEALDVSPLVVYMLHVTFAVFALYVYFWVAEGSWSASVTISGMLQSHALVLLACKACVSGQASGISGSAVTLEAIALLCRLSSTSWLKGYLPIDASADFLYQFVDFCGLALAVWLLRRMLFTQPRICQASMDTIGARPLAGVCLSLAALLHADEHHRVLFDSLWIGGVFIGLVAVVPQLQLLAQNGGAADVFVRHYLLTTLVGKFFSFAFVYDLLFSCDQEFYYQPWIEGFHHPFWSLFVAHLAHFALHMDLIMYCLYRELQRSAKKHESSNERLNQGEFAPVLLTMIFKVSQIRAPTLLPTLRTILRTVSLLLAPSFLIFGCMQRGSFTGAIFTSSVYWPENHKTAESKLMWSIFFFGLWLTMGRGTASESSTASLIHSAIWRSWGCMQNVKAHKVEAKLLAEESASSIVKQLKGKRKRRLVDLHLQTVYTAKPDGPKQACSDRTTSSWKPFQVCSLASSPRFHDAAIRHTASMVRFLRETPVMVAVIVTCIFAKDVSGLICMVLGASAIQFMSSIRISTLVIGRPSGVNKSSECESTDIPSDDGSEEEESMTEDLEISPSVEVEVEVDDGFADSAVDDSLADSAVDDSLADKGSVADSLVDDRRVDGVHLNSNGECEDGEGHCSEHTRCDDVCCRSEASSVPTSDVPSNALPTEESSEESGSVEDDNVRVSETDDEVACATPDEPPPAVLSLTSQKSGPETPIADEASTKMSSLKDVISKRHSCTAGEKFIFKDSYGGMGYGKGYLSAQQGTVVRVLFDSKAPHAWAYASLGAPGLIRPHNIVGGEDEGWVPTGLLRAFSDDDCAGTALSRSFLSSVPHLRHSAPSASRNDEVPLNTPLAR